MSPSERRSEILHLLCRGRHETAINLAVELGVSERTIRADLVILLLLPDPDSTGALWWRSSSPGLVSHGEPHIVTATTGLVDATAAKLS